MKLVKNQFKVFVFAALSASFLIGCGGEKNESEVAEDKMEEVAEETAMEEEPAQEERASPLETAEGNIGDATVKVQYGSPATRDRNIFGDLVPYGKVWRTGANEATWVEFDKDVMINGQKLAAGKYGMFTIPGENEWTVIFNKEWDQWGAMNYNEGEDVLRVNVKPEMMDEKSDRLKFQVGDDAIHFMWADTKLVVPVSA